VKFYTNVVRDGNKIYHRGYEDGKQFHEHIKYSPYVFIPSNKEKRYRTIYQEPVEKKDFDSIFEMTKFVKEMTDIEGFSIFGSTNPVTTFIYDEYREEIKYDPSKIRIGLIDIEVDSSNGFPKPEEATSPIVTISLHIENQMYAFGMKPFNAPKHVKYFQCKDEYTLLKAFLVIWKARAPDVISGWNLIGFDIPYLVNRMLIVLGEELTLQLSPIRKIIPREFFTKFGVTKTFDIKGVSLLDYMEMYKKFTVQVHGQLESYSLNYVSYFELEEEKIDYSEYESLDHLYQNNFQKFLEYNIHDVELIRRLDNKLKFFELIFVVAYMAKTNYQEVLKTIPVWESFIHHYLLDQKIVLPSKKSVQAEMTIPGGYVKEPKPGMYSWAVSYDCASLYPSIIMQYNLGPDTLKGKIDSFPSIDKLIEQPDFDHQGYSIAANGCMYSKDKKSFMAELMEKLFDMRAIVKKEFLTKKQELETNKSFELESEVSYLKAKQIAIKLLMNSLYGAMCNKHFIFFSYDLAMSITLSGQLTTRWLDKKFNEYMRSVLKTDDDYVIAADTDSIIVNQGPLVQKFLPNETDPNKITDHLSKFGSTKAQEVLDNAFHELFVYMNAYANVLKAKREKIAERAIWTGKKRYVMKILDDEGVRLKEPELKFTGIEVVRSSVPEVCRDALEEALNIIMNKDEQTLISYVDSFWEKYQKMSFYDIAYPRGVNGLEDYHDSVNLYKKGCPIHVRGSLVYNDYIKKKNLTNKYQMINSGDKIKFCYIKLPNRLKSDVIAASSKIPDEMNIQEIIDYDLQFSKSFKEPLTAILNVIGWKLEYQNTLESMFE